MQKPRWLTDALERFLWTVAQVTGGVLLDQLISGSISWRAIGYAAAITAVKLVVAHKVGRPDSAALPETRPEP